MRGALVPMGIWINILTLGATGQSTAARQQLALALPLALRSFIASSRRTREYVGELPRAVTRFRYSLTDASERALLEALEHEFVDAVVDDVMNGVEQSLLLVELCLAQSNVSMNELVHSFPWESGLKRSVEWKRKHITDQLRSMIAAGVPLPETVITALGDEGDPCFAFNEIAFAVAPKRLEWSWSDFKKHQGYGQGFLCIAEAEDEADISAEGVDYGTMTVASVMLQPTPAQDRELEIDLIVFSQEPPGPHWLGVYEAKMIHHFHHRAATYLGVSEYDRQAGNARPAEPSELQDPWFRVKTRCWVEDTTFAARMDGRPWPYSWFVSLRDVTNSTNERTAIFAIRSGAPGVDKLPSLFLMGSPGEIAWLVGSLFSFVFDYVTRQKVGGTNLGGYIVEQLPVLPRGSLKFKWFVTPEPLEAWLVSRVLELTYTAYDLEPFATDCSYSGPPFRWDEEGRFLLRCELDAAYFHLYGIGCDDVDYILKTFPIVKRRDEQAHGEYRTKRVILDIYDAMQQAMEVGTPYHMHLDPSPAQAGHHRKSRLR